MSDTIKIKTCPICAGKNAKRRVRHCQNPNEFDLVTCQQCGFQTDLKAWNALPRREEIEVAPHAGLTAVDMDRLWCLAALNTMDPDGIAKLTGKVLEYRDNPDEVLRSIAAMGSTKPKDEQPGPSA